MSKALAKAIVILANMVDDRDDEIEDLKGQIDMMRQELKIIDREYDDMVKHFTAQVNDLRAEAIKAKEYIERMRDK